MQPFTYIDEPSGIYFFAGGVATASSVQTVYKWSKPKQGTFIYFATSSGGSGGGGGGASALSTAAGGGGGGHVAGNYLFMPHAFVPDTLDLYVGWGAPGGAGGVQGGAAATNGSAGGQTRITQNGFSNSFLIDRTQTGGGGAGTTSGGAGASSFGATSSNTFPGIRREIGNAGASGNTTAGGNVQLNSTAGFTCPGAGGGGVTALNATAAGGGIIGAGFWIPSIPGGAAANAGINGLSYYLSTNGFRTFGGTGGGGNSGASAVGGRGGNGGLGGGGGGGGGANGAGSTGGRGGDGGPGFVLIVVA
jgi:hypothetical protein